MRDDLSRRLYCLKVENKAPHNVNSLLLGFFALTLLFSMLAFFIALIALIK